MPTAGNRHNIYILVGVLVLIAAISVILSPRGTALSRCNSLLFQQDKNSCIESLAVGSGNVSMCGSLQYPYSDQCYYSIAQNKSEASVCGMMSSKNDSNQCYLELANRTDDPQTCSFISGGGSSQCIYQIAVATNSTATCTGISNDSLRVLCNATVEFDSALSENNPALCSGIMTNNNTNTTYSMLENSQLSRNTGLTLNITQVVEYAAFFNQTLGARDVCYTSLAYQTSNATYCADVQNSNLSSSCTTLVGYRTGTNQTASANSNSTPVNYTNLLNECAGQAGEQQCVYGVYYIEAIGTKNVSFCGKIAAPDSYQCYYSIAQEYNSTKYCAYIGNATLNNDCILSIDGLYSNSST